MPSDPKNMPPAFHVEGFQGPNLQKALGKILSLAYVFPKFILKFILSYKV